MAAITTAGSGNWSSTTPNAPWPGGTVPTSADDVTIAKNHTVTLDTLLAVANSVTLAVGTTGADVGGKLVASTSTSSKLTLERGLTGNGSTGGTSASYTSMLELDLSAAPTVSTEIVINNSRATGTGYGIALAGGWLFKGAARKRHTTITGALTGGTSTSCVVEDVTGWRVGDILVFATTSAVTQNALSVTASSWSGGYLTCTVASTATLAKGQHVVITNMQTNLNIEWTVFDVPNATTFRIAMSDPTVTDGVGTATLLPKTDLVTIATITPGTGTTATITWSDGEGTGGAVAFNHADGCPVGNLTSNVMFSGNTVGDANYINVTNGSSQLSVNAYCTDVAFNKLGGTSSFPSSSFAINNVNDVSKIISISNCAFLNYANSAFIVRNTIGAITKNNNIFYSGPSGSTAQYNVDSVAISYAGEDTDYVIFRGVGAAGGISNLFRGQHQKRHKISGVHCTDQILYGGIYNSSKPNIEIEDCDFWANTLAFSNTGSMIVSGCRFGSEVFPGTDNTTNIRQGAGSVELTDCYLPSTEIFGNLTTYPGSTILIQNRNADAAIQELYSEQSNTDPAIQRNTTTLNRSTSSMEFTLNNASYAQEYAFDILARSGETITLKTYVRKNSSYGASTLPSVTISGLGITPVVSTMDSGTAADAWELLTTSATNSGSSDGLLTVIFTAQSSTAGAKAYFSGTPCAPFVTRARHYGYLFQETIPTVTADPYVVAAEATAAAYTGIAIDGTAKTIVFSAGTGDTAQKFYDYSRSWCALNVDKEVPFERAGSIYALDADWTIHDPYYSGDVTWSGGTVQYSTYGTLADNLDGCIVEFADTGGGTYTFTGTLSGTLDLRNLDADPITVEVPAGTTTTDANNTGGAITVQEPQVYQSVILMGGEASSRVQLYDVTSSTELYNDVPGSWPFTWTDPTPYVADREIRLRVMWVDGADANQFIDQTIGTVTDVSPALPYLVSQLDDAVYIANGIDGSALTGYAIVGTNLRIDVDDGTATWAEMYAYQVYWLSTEDGIRDQDLYIQAIDTANYVFYGGFKIRNTSSPSAPLLITGGNGEPSSGPATDLLDTTGGTIFVNSAIVVPYSSGAAVTEQIVRDGLTSQGYTTTRAGAIDGIDDALTLPEFLALK